MPIEDVAWGYDVYMNAIEKGIGNKIESLGKAGFVRKKYCGGSRTVP